MTPIRPLRRVLLCSSLISCCIALACGDATQNGNLGGGGTSTTAGNATGGTQAGSGGSGTQAGTAGTNMGGTAMAGSGGAVSTGPVHVTRTRTEYRENPMGIDVLKPRLDWLLESDIQGEKQTAYQVLVSTSQAELDKDNGDLWDSGKVVSDQSTFVEYGGKALTSRTQAFWKVKVWDKDDVASTYSATATWEMGLLSPTDWTATWIGGGSAFDTAGMNWIWFNEGDPVTSAPAGDRFFRKSFDIASVADVSSALCVATADNSFTLYVNGTQAGTGDDWHNTPIVDVKSLLTTGKNVIAISATNAEAGPAGLLAECRVTTGTGAPLAVATDATWKSANAGAANWQTSGFDDSGWGAAKQLAALGGGPWGALSVGLGGAPSPHFRKEFTVKTGLVKARAYATALGLYELSINGKRVGSDYFTPGWTDYNHRVQVQTYDVTKLVKEGANAIGAILGDGWYSGKVGFLGRAMKFGKDPAHLRIQLELEYDGGKLETFATDTSWKTSTGPIQFSDIMDGETYDARLEMPGWDSAGFTDTAWRSAVSVSDTRTLVGDVTPGVQVIQELKAQTVKPNGAGSYVYDLGQNMVGWVRLKLAASAGKTVTLKFAEVLNPDGTPYYTNLRGAKAIDHYTFKGAGMETYEPHFTFHGFRYVEIVGVDSAPGLDAITGIVVHSATPPTGTFETSSQMINQLQSNIVWGQKGNFVSVPTDCPQRDERLGWMGDALIFVRTATFNMDVASFYTKWTRDVDDGQTAQGAFGNVSPSVFESGTPAWGDAGVIVPWTVYLAYGDRRILEEHYPAMVKWVEYIKGISTGNLWQTSRGSDYGDWLSINDDTDKALLASAFYAHSVDLVARAATVLGKTDDAAKYSALFDTIKAAFVAKYIANDGKIVSDTQTAYGLAIRFGLMPNNLISGAAGYMDANVTSHTGHLSTGFVGVSHLLPALTMGGKIDTAYSLLNNDTYPSWGYEIKKGATTIWERWDGIKENGDFQDPSMNSFNHYSFGSVGEWMYSTVGGIELDEKAPGYKHFFIQPKPGGGLTSAKASLTSMYGPIATSWTLKGKAFSLDVTIPVNTIASVTLPCTDQVMLDGKVPQDMTSDGYALGSGKYTFTCNLP